MRFREPAAVLRPGDLLVVNTSATLPAALPRRALGERPVRAAPLDARRRRRLDRRAPSRRRVAAPSAAASEARLALPGGGERRGARAVRAAASGSWSPGSSSDVPLEGYLGGTAGRSATATCPAEWPLDAYQTVFAREPGSAEMPSAGPAVHAELVTELVARGVLIAPVALHTGVSSPEVGEPPFPERYRVPAATARLVNAVRTWGGRVIAVGTTVVRALETVAAARRDRARRRGAGRLLVTPEPGVRAVDGLLTGWHEPRSSHLQLLEAVARAASCSSAPTARRVRRGYRGTSSATCT